MRPWTLLNVNRKNEPHHFQLHPHFDDERYKEQEDWCQSVRVHYLKGPKEVTEEGAPLIQQKRQIVRGICELEDATEKDVAHRIDIKQGEKTKSSMIVLQKEPDALTQELQTIMKVIGDGSRVEMKSSSQVNL